ncbi:hypothetical protein EV651_102567 [Kribbella sp. VKM Ac-2571]|uniref:hypothetical protein n=1 Tax=Kribbella sp. VKM Ac-2571 TaxID=2512222 RepID=UPI00105BBFAD|nr:hypothetical protein [Kribbella sp. VKM Ac-2571]TDO68644.1 hypothetical protein EV651_102567 [Kribbella sp. VKM Ac-2571]
MADNENQVRIPLRDEPDRRTPRAATVPYSLVAAILGIAYATAHLIWSLAGLPSFVRSESLFGPVWLGAIPAAVAVAGYFFLQHRRTGVRMVAVCATSLGCTALGAYCLLLWPGLAQLLTVPFGEPISSSEVGAIALRGIGTASALGMATAVVPVTRGLRHVCVDCGRNHAVPDDAEAWRWGRVGAYFALTCFAIRMVPAVHDWIVDGGRGDPAGFPVFVALMVAAGTILPLALTHRWGEYWPRWLGPIARRPVPRWMLLVPGWMMSIGLGLYFGIGGLTALLLGKTGGALEILAYTGWGVGLAAACAAYAHRTRPACPTPLIGEP